MEATSQDALLVFGKQLATRPAVIQKLLSLSKAYKMSLQSLHTSWSQATQSGVPDDKENVLKLNKDSTIPSMNDLDKLEETLAR